MNPSMKTRLERFRLVAEIAIAGLRHSNLRPHDRARLYEGLGMLLSPPAAEAARYAATCIRECHRAEQEFLDAIDTGRGATRT